MTDKDLPLIEPFRAIAIGRRAYQLAGEGRDVLHMEYGMPSAGPPAKALDAARARLSSDLAGYWESPALRKALSARYREDYGVTVAPERFILTCGASPALVLAMAASFTPGDRIAFARPGYVAYRNVARGQHLTPLEIGCGPESRFQLTRAHLDALDPAPQGVILSSPANPTGSIIPDQAFKEIAEFCRERNITLISDEIYHRITYSAPARSALEFSDEAYIVGSFSKYYCMPGWRLGWLIAPEESVERINRYCGNYFLTPPVLSQHMALAAMASTDELEERIEIYRANRELLLEALPSLGLGDFAPPDGAFYFYINISDLTDDSEAFCLRLLEETGIAAAPGVDFDPVEGQHYLRLSFAISTPDVEAALSRLRDWLPTAD